MVELQDMPRRGLQEIKRKYDKMFFTGFIWLEIETSGGGDEYLEVYSVAEHLLSTEELRFMEWIN
jgi:hypothetical protein